MLPSCLDFDLALGCKFFYKVTFLSQTLLTLLSVTLNTGCLDKNLAKNLQFTPKCLPDVSPQIYPSHHQNCQTFSCIN